MCIGSRGVQGRGKGGQVPLWATLWEYEGNLWKFMLKCRVVDGQVGGLRCVDC